MDYKYFKLTGEAHNEAAKWHKSFDLFIKKRNKKIRILTKKQDVRLWVQDRFFGGMDVIGLSAQVPGSIPIKKHPEFFKPDGRTVAGRQLKLTLQSFEMGTPFPELLKKFGMFEEVAFMNRGMVPAKIFVAGDEYFLKVPTALLEKLSMRSCLEETHLLDIELLKD
jgi:hypothetical protein